MPEPDSPLPGTFALISPETGAGLEGLTWGISSMPPEGSNNFPVVLVAERFCKRMVRYTSGECRASAKEIFCVTAN